MPADERASLHFARFADAMNELTVGAHGWIVHAGERNTGGAIKHVDGRWASGGAIALQREIDPRLKQGWMYVERGTDFDQQLIDGLRRASHRPVPPIRAVRRTA